MRIHAAIAATCLAGTAALGGCADIPFTDDTFTLSNAASMRVEVEVYKGPLSKTVPVQWGELEGLVNTAVDSLEIFGQVICQTINNENLKPACNRNAANSLQSDCESASNAARPVSEETDIADQILRRMYADAECLLDEAEALQRVVQQRQLDALGCQGDRAAAGSDGAAPGLCSVYQADTEYMSAEAAIAKAVERLQSVDDLNGAIARGDGPKLQNDVDAAGKSVKDAEEAIKGAAKHLNVTLAAVEDARKAASDSKATAKAANAKAAAANSYVHRRDLLTDAKAAGSTVEKRLIEFTDRLDEFRNAIVEARDHAKQAEEPDRDAGGLGDTLAEIHSALRDAKLLAKASEEASFSGQANLPGRMAFKEWLDALEEIDDPAKNLMANEASALSDRVTSSVSSLNSATSTVSEIATGVESMQGKPADNLRTRAAEWRRRLAATANGLERDRAKVARLRDRVSGIDNKVDLLMAQIEMDKPPAHTRTDETSDAANGGISDALWEAAAREQVVRGVGDFAVRLKAKAFNWAETHTALAPCCRKVRIAMARFAVLISELSNHLESRADALQWQLDDKFGTDARELPLSLYLRDAEPTDFLNLYTWNRAAAAALLPDMFWHPWNAFSSDETADRVRVIERLFADHNWGKINTVYGSGQGDFSMALVKDEIGNWSLKSFEADPTKLVEAYTDLTLAALTKIRRTITGSKLPQPELLRLTGNLAAGQIGDSAGPFDVFDTGRLHERVVGELTGIREDAVKTRDALAAKRDETTRKAVETEAKARSSEARAESAPLNPGPTTCAAPASCPVEATLAKAREAETEALEARIGVRDLKQGATDQAASTTITLADEAVKRVRNAETKAAAAAASPPANGPDTTKGSEAPAGDTPKPTDDSAKEAHLLAEKAKAYAAAATAWAAHADAIAKRESAVAGLNVHRGDVIARIRDVLDDYSAVIGTLLESRTPSGSDPEMMDEAQSDSGSDP